MHACVKLSFIALISSALLAVAVGSSSANRLGLNETGIRVTYSPLSFVPSFGTTARCNVTLSESYHSRTLTKTADSLIGYINAAAASSCTSGNVRMNVESLPWHLKYASFSGTLPSITAIDEYQGRISFEVHGEIFGIRVVCRYTTPVGSASKVRESRGAITSQTPGNESISSETGGCPSLRLSGTGVVKTSAGATVTASLI